MIPEGVKLPHEPFGLVHEAHKFAPVAFGVGAFACFGELADHRQFKFPAWFEPLRSKA